MERKDDNYYVEIEQEFILSGKKFFKSRFTPWVYLYLKLENNYNMHRLPGKSGSLKVKDISRLLKINESTVYRCIDELKDKGLIQKNYRDSYKVFFEKGKLNKSAKCNYIMVYKNLFIDILENSSVNEAMIYYYMIQNNRHYAFDFAKLQSELSQSKISKELGMDSRDVKMALSNLEKLGLILKDDKKYFTMWPHNKRSENISIDNHSGLHEKINNYLNSRRKEDKPVPITGWFRTKSGSGKCPIISVPGYGNVVWQAKAEESGGIPPSDEEWSKILQLVLDNHDKKMMVTHVC